MKILFAAPENAWGGFFDKIRNELPEHHFTATGRFGLGYLKGGSDPDPDHVFYYPGAAGRGLMICI